MNTFNPFTVDLTHVDKMSKVRSPITLMPRKHTLRINMTRQRRPRGPTMNRWYVAEICRHRTACRLHSPRKPILDGPPLVCDVCLDQDHLHMSVPGSRSCCEDHAQQMACEGKPQNVTRYVFATQDPSLSLQRPYRIRHDVPRQRAFERRRQVAEWAANCCHR